MNLVLSTHVSLFEGVRSPEVLDTLPLGEVLAQIRDGKWREAVVQVRTIKEQGEALYKAAKERLLAFTPCCAMYTRDKDVPLNERIASVGGIVHFDFDHVGDPAELKATLAVDPATVFAFVSPGGDGVKVGIAVNGLQTVGGYGRAWHAVLRQLKRAHPGRSLVEDAHIKYIHALCFVSYDPDLYWNPAAVPLVLPEQGPDDEDPPLSAQGQASGDFDYFKLAHALEVIQSDDYDTWIAIGQALHSSGHTDAKGLWDAWSKRSTKYKQAAQDKKWAGFTVDGGRDLGEVYTRAHQRGWRPTGWGTGAAGITSQAQDKKIGDVTHCKITTNGITSLTSLTSQLCEEHGEASTPSSSRPWPTLHPAALYGLAGDFVRAIAPQTEADPAAILAQFLTEFGIVAGRHCYAMVGETRHYANLFTAIVGKTARSRKGTSYGYIEGPMQAADPTWSRAHHIKGAGSGEGLIFAVRDRRTKMSPVKEQGHITSYQEEVIDDGVDDKRALYHTGEFSSILKVAGRDGNTLSETLRDIWDSGYLRITTKNNPITATDAHIGVIGHITMDEVRKLVTSTDLSNGFANRFMWICAKRSQLLPHGGDRTQIQYAPLIERLRHAVSFSSELRHLVRNFPCTRAWEEVYPLLSEDKTGLANTLLARSEPIVLRLSMLYAMLDCSEEMTLEHLNAALALWQYAEDSAVYVFGDTVGDDTADAILQGLAKAGADGLTREQVSIEVFQRHVKAAELSRAFALLEEQGRVTRVEVKRSKGAGRPTTFYRLVTLWSCEVSEVSEVILSRYLIASNKAAKQVEVSDHTSVGDLRSNSSQVPEPVSQSCEVSEVSEVIQATGAVEVPPTLPTEARITPLLYPTDTGDGEEEGFAL